MLKGEKGIVEAVTGIKAKIIVESTQREATLFTNNLKLATEMDYAMNFRQKMNLPSNYAFLDLVRFNNNS